MKTLKRVLMTLLLIVLAAADGIIVLLAVPFLLREGSLAAEWEDTCESFTHTWERIWIS